MKSLKTTLSSAVEYNRHCSCTPNIVYIFHLCNLISAEKPYFITKKYKFNIYINLSHQSEMEISAIYHGFNEKENELVFCLLDKNEISIEQIEEILELLKPGKNEFMYQQVIAGLIPENEKMASKWQFIRDDYHGCECLLLLKEFVLDGKADQKLAIIIDEIEKLKAMNQVF